MKKFFLLLILFSISTSGRGANFMDNTVIGIAFINQSVKMELTGPNISVSDSASGSGFGIYLDKYYKRNYRFNGTLAFFGYSGFDITELIFSADYLLPMNDNITLFAGLALGGALQKYNSASLTDSALGGVYGAQLGAIAYINKNLMLELGYRYRPASIETEISGTNLVNTINDMSESYFSILLMF